MKTIFAIVSTVIIAGCVYNTLERNLILHDKPLSVIRSNIQGKWKLQYVKGGLCANCAGPVRHNPYMIIDNDRIVFGDDSLSVVVDTIIVWKKDKDIFNDSTFLLSYRYSKGYAYPYYQIVDRIQNGTLVIIDNAYDAFYYYYTQ